MASKPRKSTARHLRWFLSCALGAGLLAACGNPSSSDDSTRDAATTDTVDGASPDAGTDTFVPRDAADTGDTTDRPPNVWSRLIGTSSFDRAVAVDLAPQGGAYVAGRTQEAIGETTYNGGGFDGWVARFGEHGQRRWVRLIGSDQGDLIWGVATGSSGAVYVAGESHGEIADARGTGAAFVAKYGPDGTRRWIRRLGSGSEDRAVAVAPAPDGGVYVTGRTGGGFGDESFRGGKWDAFVARYGAGGDRRWLDIHGTGGNDVPAGITSAGSEGLYVVGRTNNELGGESYLGGSSDGFAVRYGTDGARDWTRLVGGAGLDAATDAAVLSEGEVVVSGRSDTAFGGATAPGGPSDGFVAALSPSGEQQWVRFAGSSAGDVFRGISWNDEGPVVAVGTTNGAPEGTTNGGQNDILIAEIGSGGEQLQAGVLGTRASESGLDVARLSNGLFYVAGGTTGSYEDSTFNGGASDGLLLRVE